MAPVWCSLAAGGRGGGPLLAHPGRPPALRAAAWPCVTPVHPAELLEQSACNAVVNWFHQPICLLSTTIPQVLYLTEPIDEVAVQNLQVSRDSVSISQAGLHNHTLFVAKQTPFSRQALLAAHRAAPWAALLSLGRAPLQAARPPTHPNPNPNPNPPSLCCAGV